MTQKLIATLALCSSLLASPSVWAMGKKPASGTFVLSSCDSRSSLPLPREPLGWGGLADATGSLEAGQSVELALNENGGENGGLELRYSGLTARLSQGTKRIEGPVSEGTFDRMVVDQRLAHDMLTGALAVELRQRSAFLWYQTDAVARWKFEQQADGSISVEYRWSGRGEASFRQRCRLEPGSR
jgi:hypothetical protein